MHWKDYRYKNTTFLLISVILALFLLRVESLQNFLLRIGELGYIGAFLAGVLFTSTFTIAIGTIVLLVLAESLSPVEIGIIAGLGSMMGDFLIFRFIKDNLTYEVQSLYEHIDGKHHVQRIFHSKYFSWSLPVIGAILIASPLPDEIGVSLMGISKMKTYQFLIISFIFNVIGIFLVVSASYVIKP